jgi:hypothetical protein
MESKSLIRIIRAVATHVSKDRTRSHLMCVAVTSDRRIEATDGKRAIRIDTDPPHGLPVGLYNPKRLLALLKNEATITPDAALIDWPTLDCVIPPVENDKRVATLIDPQYLAQAASALFDASGDDNASIRIQPGADEWDAIRLDVKSKLASGIAVIAPRRA